MEMLHLKINDNLQQAWHPYSLTELNLERWGSELVVNVGEKKEKGLKREE